MKRYFSILSLTVLTLAFMSFNTSNSKINKNQSSFASSKSLVYSDTQTDSLDNIVQTIINICANDFYKHQRPVPAGFRNVMLKIIKKDNGEELYVLCGQFLMHDKQNKDEWAPFATIKNSNYEQYIGANALTFCQDAKQIPYSKRDLSAALKSKLDSLRKGQK